ncbi:hypothetical protein, partial [Leptospira borgpetersenii]|uniref:hypothetical protein n=1 Tax=Leptospira borgpetersenii TaxID=174 RepID=UPI0027DE3690
DSVHELYDCKLIGISFFDLFEIADRTWNVDSRPLIEGLAVRSISSDLIRTPGNIKSDIVINGFGDRKFESDVRSGGVDLALFIVGVNVIRIGIQKLILVPIEDRRITQSEFDFFPFCQGKVGWI